jgi:hypothetical protein
VLTHFCTLLKSCGQLFSQFALAYLKFIASQIARASQQLGNKTGIGNCTSDSKMFPSSLINNISIK